MIVATTSGAVTVLTLSQPPVNAISEEWVRSFDTKLDELASGPPCTVLHIRSDQKVFCAGADLREIGTHMEAPDGAERMYRSCCRGEIVSLMGRNGMAKTTTLRTPLGLVRPRQGTALVVDKDIETLATPPIAASLSPWDALSMTGHRPRLPPIAK